MKEGKKGRKKETRKKENRTRPTDLLSQLLPVQPPEHWHAYPPFSMFTHVPPCKHGLESQGFTAEKMLKFNS